MISIVRIALAAGLVALAPLGARAAETATITIDNFTFGPATLTVAKGTTVVWLNRDDSPHRVASTTQSFKSPVLDSDEKYSWTFTTPGSFAYFCTMHPHMTGKVVVTE